MRLAENTGRKKVAKNRHLGTIAQLCWELLGLFIRVCIALCTIVAHNIAQNRPDTIPSYPPDNHHCSDDVYLREGGVKDRAKDADVKGQEVKGRKGGAPATHGAIIKWLWMVWFTSCLQRRWLNIRIRKHFSILHSYDTYILVTNIITLKQRPWNFLEFLKLYPWIWAYSKTFHKVVLSHELGWSDIYATDWYRKPTMLEWILCYNDIPTFCISSSSSSSSGASLTASASHSITTSSGTATYISVWLQRSTSTWYWEYHG